jgi:hypothetical protein
VLENLGANRYVYRETPLLQLAARGPAAPALGIAPAGAREVGLIEVSVEYSGMGAGGLRDSEADFYPRLAALAGEMGGTQFMVLRSAHVSRFGVDWINTLTVDVFEQQ